MTALAWVDGRVVPAVDATVSALDAGLRSGIGVFETLRARAGRTFRLEHHVARAVAGAAALGIEVAGTTLLRAVGELLDAEASARGRARESLDDLVVRVTVTAGPIDPSAPFPAPPLGRATVVITTHAAPPLPPPPARGVTVAGGRALAAHKSTSYAASWAATRAARAAGGDLALLVDDGRLVEAADGNVLGVIGTTLVAPPVGSAALAGITRAALLELADAGALGLDPVERPLHVDELAGLDALVVTSAVSGVRAVADVDGRRVGGEAIAAALRTAYDDLVARESDPPWSAGARD